MDENSNKAYVEPADALLSNPHAAVGGIGSPLFVINLCASMAPAQVVGKTLPGLDEYRLYQVSRVEDGRTRYRLRLGFFTSQGSAESVLATVREKYPTAFTACLSDDDRKFTRGYVPSAPAVVVRTRPVAVVTQATPAPAPKLTPTPQVAKQTPTPGPAKQAPHATAPNGASKPVSNAANTARAATPAAPAAPAPKAVATATPTKPVDPDESAVVELTWEPEARPNAKLSQSTPGATGSSRALDESDITEIEITWAKAEQAPAKAAASGQPATAATAAPAAVSAAPGRQPNSTGVKAAPATKPAQQMHSAARAPAKVIPEAKKPSAAPEKSPTSIELKLEIEPAPAPKQAPAAPTHLQKPFHVGKGVNIPDVAFSLQQDSTSTAVKAKPAEAPATKIKPGSSAPRGPNAQGPIRQGSSPPASKAPAHAAAQSASTAAPQARIAPESYRAAIAANLDSTQTIRALTNAELSDDSQEKWFAIQLAVSEQPVNLDAMPHLDIFEAYRLYSIASAEGGKIAHSLRLGFFREAVSAEAVSGYLKTFFAAPSVLRISAAEQLRFKDAASLIAPVAEPKSEQKVVDLSHARERAARPVIPTITMEVAPPKGATVDRSPTGAYKMGPVGSPDAGATAKYKTLTPTLKPAAKPAAKRPAARQGAVSSSGRYRTLPRKSLQDQLLDEAREVELTESGIRRLPKNDSLLSRLVDRLKK